jgi:adenine-specific DNA-methyltransferase
MQAQDLIQRVATYDESLARDLQKFIGARKLGLVYEESKPEYVRLTNKPVVVGDLVNVLPPRGIMEDLSNDHDEHDVIWHVTSIEGDEAALLNLSTGEHKEAKVDDLVPIARFDQPIYCGLTETGRVERGKEDDPYHVVINGENYHALESLLYSYRGKVDCIYIDPPYNTGAKDWKYNNNYVGGDDAYRHSKWLTFMEDRLRLAKLLLNPEDSVLICSIDEKEYLRLGLLLEQTFPEANIQMISITNNHAGTGRSYEFARVNEYAFYVRVGCAQILPEYEYGNEHKSVLWDVLRRSELSNIRPKKKTQFFPVFVNDSTGRIESVGDPITPDVDISSVSVPKGCTAVFPIRDDGIETSWSCKKEEMENRIRKGYIKVGKRTPEKPQKYSLTYIKTGAIEDIESGKAVIEGRNKDGSVRAYYSDRRKKNPPTVLVDGKYDARANGTNLINAFIGNRFDYPKSLYSVEDCLRFIIANNPNALVLDFFAGSGTTAHAVMRLNHMDDGNRRSVSITNNEVSFDDAKALTRRGLRQGDEEWEHLGIARYVAGPRITAAITGKTPEGEPVEGDYKFTDEFPMSDGFEENAVFYDLTYLEPSVVSADLAFDEIAPLLWMRAGSRGPVIKHGDTYQITDRYGVLFDYACAAAFTRECHERDIDHIFVVTDIDANYRHMCSEFRGKDVAQLYKSYLRSFEIGADR